MKVNSTIEEEDSNKCQHKDKNHATTKTNNNLQTAIEESKLSIFLSVIDLGFFGWSSTLSSSSASASKTTVVAKSLEKVTISVTPKTKKDNQHLLNISSSDIKSKIHLQHLPKKVCNINDLNQVCPQKYHKLKKCEHWNQYPYAIPYIVPLYVASTHRFLDLSTIDFMFGGGSILQLFASKSIPTSDKLLVQIIPTTTDNNSIIFIGKYPIYSQNLSDPGFQFERFITGCRMDDIHHNSQPFKNQHLQVFQIGRQTKSDDDDDCYSILCSAECDGITYENDVVEMKLSRQNWQTTRVMFQMISNGSSLLYSGERGSSSNRAILNRVHENTLSDVIDKSLAHSDCATLERNICYCLKELKHKMSSSSSNKKRMIQEVYFQSGRLMLRPYHGCKNDSYLFFPPDDVVKELLS